MKLQKTSRNRVCGILAAFLVGMSLAFSTVIADDNDWVFDISGRAAETVSSGTASLSSTLDSRSVSALESPASTLDSRCGDSQASAPRALKSTSFGLRIIFR